VSTFDWCVGIGGTQLGFLSGDVDWRPFLRIGTSRLPGACCVLILGESARRLFEDLIPRADAKLLAIEELISRGGIRRGIWRVDGVAGVRRGLACAPSFVGLRSSETAAEVVTVFSEVASTTTGVSVGNFKS
jgi:hypothetical protein